MEKLNWGFMVFVLLLISMLHFGTSFVDQSVQKQLDRVSNLPGQGPNFSFENYAGYVTVNEESGRALFYWFFEAVDDPSTKPLVVWLDGGPGCSSIALGAAKQVGPFHIEKDGKNIYWNPYSWNLAANILFVDSPVGAGYSYSNTTSDHLNNGDKRTAADSLEFFLKWFERFPEYKERDFYLTGESYAGHYIPQLSQAIVRYNQALKMPVINLKGFMVGNPVTDDYYTYLGSFQFLWSAGMISDQTFKEANVFCDFDSFVKPAEQCQKILDKVTEEVGSIDRFSIFSPTCTDKLRQSNVLHRLRRSYDPCTDNYSQIYFNLPETQKALHVHNTNSSFKWEPCSNEVMTNWKDSATTVLDVYRELIHSGLRIWIFSGDTDSVVPVPSTRHSINALNLPTVGPWQAWYVDGQVGGWMQEYKGLTFVTVRGAGHQVSLDRPKQTLTVFKSFLAGVSITSFEQLRGS